MQLKNVHYSSRVSVSTSAYLDATSSIHQFTLLYPLHDRLKHPQQPTVERDGSNSNYY